MGEKRKPNFVFLLKKPGKETLKIEVFNVKQHWPEKWTGGEWWRAKQFYRIRFNGKWLSAKKGKNKYVFFTKYQIRDMMWKSIVNKDMFD